MFSGHQQLSLHLLVLLLLAYELVLMYSAVGAVQIVRYEWIEVVLFSLHMMVDRTLHHDDEIESSVATSE